MQLWGIPDFKIGETRTPEFGASKNVLHKKIKNQWLQMAM
jgi:hypothetical protein